MKTIFITSFHPLISRNILSTGLLRLLAPPHRVVLFVPEEKAAYFGENFSRANVIIEGIASRLSARDLLFRRLALDMLPTAAMYMKKRLALYQDKNVLKFLASALPAVCFGRSSLALSVVRWLDHRSLRRQLFTPYLMKYRPALVFATDVQNEFDVRLLQESKRLGVPHLAMVRSWDNLTSKGIIRALPQRLLVHNDLITAEAVRYSRVPAERISVIGIQHYDAYHRPPGQSREEFFLGFGFDLQKPLILWAPIGDRYIKNNRTDLAALGAASELDLNILVRLPPQDTVNFVGFSSRRARVVFDETGVRSWSGGKKSSELPPEDDERLIASLTSCDLVVTGHSTIMVDAMLFDRPVVNIGFDAEPRNYWDSFARYFDREYIRPVVESGGVRLARSPRELIEAIQRYLRDPALDRQGRERIRQLELGPNDGRATRRLGAMLLSYLS